MNVIQKNQLLAILSASIAALGPFDGAVCRLFTNDIVLTPTLTWADFVEADFGGYAVSAALVWGDAVVQPPSLAVSYGSTIEFASDGTDPSNIVYGWALTTAGGSPTLLQATKFSTPISLVNLGDAAIVFPHVLLGNQ